MKSIGTLFFCFAALGLAQERDYGIGKAAGEILVTAGGQRFEGGSQWALGTTLGYAHNAFNKPNLPLLFEYNGGVFTSNSEYSSSASSMHYIGGGVRIGGSKQTRGVVPFAGFTVGGARSTTETLFSIDNRSSRITATGTIAAISVSGGLNIPVSPRWGVRVDVRGITGLENAGSGWLYQFGGGIYYRLGK